MDNITIPKTLDQLQFEQEIKRIIEVLSSLPHDTRQLALAALMLKVQEYKATKG